MQFQDRSFSGGLSIIDFLDGWVAAIQNAHGEEPLGMYANYPDPTLTAEQAHTAYWLDNYERLSALKTEFDPEGVFMHPQAINSGTD
jgi:FAD/FMN-containing dehydrogenase